MIARLLLPLAAVMLFSPQAFAQKDYCSRAAQVAESLMNARQKGVSLQDAMEALKSSYPKNVHGFIEKLVISAYEIPRYSSSEYQRRAAGEFRDKAHLQCLKTR